MKNIRQILKQQLEIIKPEEKIIDKINKISKEFCESLRKKLKNKKIKADVFIGGSVAKKTLIKKNKYDVDVFVRFDISYKNKDISKILESILKNSKKIHGSRDYFQIEKNKILIEIVPVLNIKKPEQAENVTDLSYFHVRYVLNKLKNKKLADEIRLAKSFIHSNNLYGAESYINGFSGYSIELLITHYKGFLKFLKEIVKVRVNEKIIIDDSKFYKNKKDILNELNESKFSPIILIDPTYKERNALACLSHESFERFKKIAKQFLKNPNLRFFKEKDIKDELKKKYKKKLIILKVSNNKQKGDISGTKSKKFFDYFNYRLKENFEIKLKEFEYNESKNESYFYFVLNKKKDEIRQGPEITDVYNLQRFKKRHKNAFIKNKRSYVKIKHDLSFGKFLILIKKDKTLKSMGIKEIKIVA